MPPQLRDWLAAVNEAKRREREHGYRRTIISVRESLEWITRKYVTDIPQLGWVRDDVITGRDFPVPVRVYHPDPQTPLPVALFVHGGGHVGGSVSLYDGIARKIAKASGRVLVSVEYRLAPECPYPAGLKDTLACAKRVFRCLEGLSLPFEPRLALIGDSGGGALCATVSHLAQFDPALRIERQVLIYPSLDYSLSQPSVTTNGVGYMLERERILWMFDAYLQNAENRREISPLFMSLTSGYPETLIITAEFDPLRDEGIAYHQRLLDHGIPSAHIDMPGMIHAFLNLEDLVPESCEKVYRDIGKALAVADAAQGSPQVGEND